MSALVQAQKLNRLVVFSLGWGGKTFIFVYMHVLTEENLYTVIQCGPLRYSTDDCKVNTISLSLSLSRLTVLVSSELDSLASVHAEAITRLVRPTSYYSQELIFSVPTVYRTPGLRYASSYCLPHSRPEIHKNLRGVLVHSLTTQACIGRMPPYPVLHIAPLNYCICIY